MYADKIRDLANDILKLIKERDYYVSKRAEALEIWKN